MNDNTDAQIIDAEEIPVIPSYNPNKTEQIVNLVQITAPSLDSVVTPLPDAKKKKLTKETISTIVNLYTQVCKDNGFDIQWDIDSIQRNFDDIIDDNKEQILRILMSKAFSKFQVVFYQQAMINIMTLMQQVSAPEVINDTSVSIEYKYGMMNQLFSLMNQVSDMYDKVRVDNPNLILKNIASKQVGEDLDSIQMDPKTIEVMKQLKKISLGVKDESES